VSQTAQTSNSLGWSKKIQFLQNAGNANKIFFSFLSIPISTSIPTYCVNIYRFIRPKIRLQCVFLCKNQKIFPAVIFRDLFVEAECRERKDKGVKTIYSLFGGIDL
jgi:hypothetical protein